MKKSAFTLIELLVVIAIISILAALAVPQIAKALETGKAVSDSNNLHGVGELFFKYLTDHDDEVPAIGAGVVWPDQLHKNGADYKVFRSPFDKRPPLDGSGAPVSYGLNQAVYGRATSDFISPSSLVFMSDAAISGPHGSPAFSGTASTNVTVSAGANSGVYRGNTLINVLYADMHVAPLTLNDFNDAGSNLGRKRWDPLYDDTQ